MPATRLTRRAAAALLLALAGRAAAQEIYLAEGPGIGHAGDLYGQSVAQLHDVNGDGVNDLLVGAPGTDSNGVDAGTAYVLDGLSGDALYEVHGLAGDELGWSVANVGDVTGDGIDDFAAGRPGRDVNGADAGAVSMYSGAGGGILWTQVGTKAGMRHGSVVAGAGDVNGDGRGDLLVGAPDYDGAILTGADLGRVVLYSGNNGLALLTILGTTAGDRLGAALAGLPDLTGDGRPEFAIGVPGREIGSPLSIVNAGSCQVYSGASLALLFGVDGSGGDEACGSAVCALGDSDGDGVQEFAVGRPGWSAGRGRVTVHAGGAGKLIHTLDGPQHSSADLFGSALSGAGDVNKDGRDDLLVGAPAPGTGVKGYAIVHSGKDWTPYGDDMHLFSDTGFGSAVAGGLDTSGDGWVDVLCGTPTADLSGVDAGYVFGYEFSVQQPTVQAGGPGSAELHMYGTPLAGGGVADLRVTGAPAFAPVYLLASPASAPASFKGGVLVPQVSSALFLTLPANGQGTVTLTGIPGGGGPLVVYLQAVIPVPIAAQGYWLTNALAAQLLP